MVAGIKPQLQWQQATWDDYVALRDDRGDRYKLFFDHQRLWVDMGAEGMNHAKFGDLFVMLLFLWATKFPHLKFSTFSGCQLELKGQRSVAPDLVLYMGEDVPVWEVGQSRFIDLDRWRAPDLVGEIADTTLAIDLDEKKRLYAELGIAEYWVADVKAYRLFAFQLDATKVYQPCDVLRVLPNLAITLLEKTVELLATKTNIEAAMWFAQQM